MVRVRSHSPSRPKTKRTSSSPQTPSPPSAQLTGRVHLARCALTSQLHMHAFGSARLEWACRQPTSPDWTAVTCQKVPPDLAAAAGGQSDQWLLSGSPCRVAWGRRSPRRHGGSNVDVERSDAETTSHRARAHTVRGSAGNRARSPNQPSRPLARRFGPRHWTTSIA